MTGVCSSQDPRRPAEMESEAYVAPGRQRSGRAIGTHRGQWPNVAHGLILPGGPTPAHQC